MWIIANQMNIAYEMLERWGYSVIDKIIWVKLKGQSIFLTHGYYFMHSYEICLVGYKCPPGQHFEYRSKISNNLIFSQVQIKSQKPKELYDIIELMLPGSKKIELFARNHNRRQGWFSLGNQLGDVHQKWINKVSCDICQQVITCGNKRFKSRARIDFDVC